MHQDRENLDIIFRRTTPEIILENIKSYKKHEGNCKLEIGTLKYSERAYQHFGAFNMIEYSPDEIAIRYHALEEQIEKGGQNGIFALLYDYAEQVLVSDGVKIECILDRVLDWNSITLRLGQDIFTTAWLAWQDVKKRNITIRERTFDWPAVLETEDRRLKLILQKGLAENHFHLHGSTQSFALSWTCLMNHPERIREFVAEKGRFEENLNMNGSFGVLDNVLDWTTRLTYAAQIRVLLFERCIGMPVAGDGNEEEEKEKVFDRFWKFHCFSLASDVKQEVELLRNSVAEKFEQVEGRRKCLDYANCKKLYHVNEHTTTRLLEGERGLLYNCFRMQFEGKFTKLESMLFYLYLVIKSNFRSELIQCNKRTGFHNFSEYQDRKNQFFGIFDEYWTEAQRLSVGNIFIENNVVSLEARIMPKKEPWEMKTEIESLKQMISKASNGETKKWNYYYVIHFAKKKFGVANLGSKYTMPIPRNHAARKLAKVGAISLNGYLKKYDTKGENVCGIDACSSEIGCRPEVFATEFRYLYGCSNDFPAKKWYQEDCPKHAKLGLTYHVGEDFLDIADGLRAVDEAVFFLELKKGDRIGHGTVLGIGAEKYYERKRWTVYLPKQDYLDNIVWLLYRSLEWNIDINSNCRERMRKDACRLILEIYGEVLNTSELSGYDLLDGYYESWELRGDHPELYCTGDYKKSNKLSIEPYYKYMERGNLEMARRNRLATRLYAAYHFNYDVKYRGLQAIGIKIDEEYAELMSKFQNAMRMELSKKGISIECNPTSNVLISNFRYYDKHPIFTFNHHHLESDTSIPNLPVSINTDDIGVFDTSLANEYALLLAAALRSRHAVGNYDDDAVYQYLDYVREFGIEMAFKQ